jgi:hypothetical protein
MGNLFEVLLYIIERDRIWNPYIYIRPKIKMEN